MAQTALAHSFPALIRQPMTISILASLGLHGLFALGFPNATKPLEPSPEPVKVVELTPAEQGRLPRANIPYIPQTPLPSTLPSNQSPSLSSLFPNLTPNRSTALLPPGSMFPSQNLPLTTQPAVPWSWSLPPRQSVPTTRPAAPSPKPGTTQMTLKPGPTVKNSALDSLIGAQTSTPSSPEASPASPQNPSPSPSPGVEVKRPDKIPDQAITRMRELQAQKRASSQTDAGNGEAGVEYAELGGWLEKNNASLGKNFEITASAPQNQQGTVIVGVIVDSEGKILPETFKVLKKSGNESLDNAALEVIKNQTLPRPEEGRAYLITVKFGGNTSEQPLPNYGA